MTALISNNKRKSKLSFPLFLMVLLSFYACEDTNTDHLDPSFDRGALLTSVANNLIIPNFTSLQSSVDDLAKAADIFLETTNVSNLVALQSAWVEAVKDHQHCSAFGFGPANLPLGPYAEVLGVFPVNEQKVAQNINNPNFDLPNSFDRDIRGFYTIEYLIYGNSMGTEDLLASFDQGKKDYLILILEELKNTVDGIVNEWNSNYLQTFIQNDGTSAGSSISLYYNSFVKDYENLKNFKLELPAGLTAGQVEGDGSLVEAYYSGISKDLILEHFQSSKNIWSGNARSGAEVLGFEAYLESVVGGPELIDQTKEAIIQIDNSIGNLPDGPLSEIVDSPEVKILRDRLQENTANFKSSLSSLLGISITFNSGDGD